MRYGILSTLMVLSSTLLSPNAHALSPPWDLYASEARATLQADACVTVSNLEGTGPSYRLDIHVCDYNKARALAVVLDSTKTFGAITVDVRVYGPYGGLVPSAPLPPSHMEQEELLNRAFTGNCLFIQIVHGNPVNPYFAEFAKAVVQFFGDNLADAYANINVVAADAFESLLKPGIPVTTSETYISSCGGTSK